LLEALRLAFLLTEDSRINQPKTNALIALICFHASRFAARQVNDNDFVLYEHQDETLWDLELINQGNHFLELSAQGAEISSYHLEAGIAFWHCQKQDTKEKWEHILYHYNLLLRVNFSPVAAMNRVYALYKVNGKLEAIAEARKLDLQGNRFYYTLLGELFTGINNETARSFLEKALQLARTDTDRQILRGKLTELGKG